MLDPDNKILKEFPLIPGTKPYTAPYAEPYSASADDKNQIVWTHDFSSDRLYRIDMNTDVGGAQSRPPPARSRRRRWQARSSGIYHITPDAEPLTSPLN
jgi:streptogramin lyase